MSRYAATSRTSHDAKGLQYGQGSRGRNVCVETIAVGERMLHDQKRLLHGLSYLWPNNV